MRQFHNINTNSGLGLLELMIALTLGILLTGSILVLFNTSKETYNTNEALARVQENGRFALEVLKREMREGGAHGFCAGRLPITSHLNICGAAAIDAIYDPVRTISGWEFSGTGNGEDYTLGDAGNWSGTTAGLPIPLQGNVSLGSDVLLMRKLEVLPGISGVNPSTTGVTDPTMALNQAHGLAGASLVLVTDCSFSDLFHNMTGPASTDFDKAAGASNCGNLGPGNVNAPMDWSVFHSDGLQAFQVQMHAYYIGTNASNQPGLYRMDFSRGFAGVIEEEMIRGAESFQVLYGFSAAAPAGDGESVDFWLSADDVPANGWDQVLAIWVGISVASENIADSDRSDQILSDLVGVPGTGVDIEIPGDGRLRKAFSATITLRNQILVIDD